MKIHLLQHQGGVGGVCSLAEHIEQLLKQDCEVVTTNLENGELDNNHLNSDCHVAITIFSNLELFRQIKFPNKKIAYLFPEYTGYTPKVLSLLCEIDELWVTSKWHYNIFKNHFPNPIHIVPAGIDPNIFNPNIETEQSIDDISGFKFLCVARPYTRKNLFSLVKTFIKEFDGKDAKLFLAMGVANLFPEFKHKQIINISPVLHHATLARLYKSCNAFVLPTRSEGWGLPICEAMACGLPVITTLYSAITEYADENLIYPIDYKMIETNSTNLSQFDGNIIEQHAQGQWADPDPQHLQHLMRYVYNNYRQAKEKGLKASKHILGNFTWEHTGKILKNII